MSDNKLYACICAIAKDEPDIRDWVDYHLAIGFDKIWIFDNNSRVSIAKVLADHVRQGIVEVHEIPLKDSPQLSAYATFLKEFRQAARWVAFIDADEYVNVKEASDISEFLEDYEQYPAVAVSWRMFGSNGHLTRPGETTMTAYTGSLGGHPLIKSIVQPLKVKRVVSPHNFEYDDGLLCVNEHCIPVVGPRSYHTSEKIQINHYYFKSQRDFEEKMKRGMATIIKHRDSYDMAEFYKQAKSLGEAETSILRFFKKFSLYSKMGPDFIAGEIRKRIQVDIQSVLKEVTESVVHGSVDEGIKRIRRALRYAKEPSLYVSLAKLHAAQGEYDSSFKALASGMAVAGDNPPARKGLFKELASLYDAIGLSAQKESILQELNR